MTILGIPLTDVFPVVRNKLKPELDPRDMALKMPHKLNQFLRQLKIHDGPGFTFSPFVPIPVPKGGGHNREGSCMGNLWFFPFAGWHRQKAPPAPMSKAVVEEHSSRGGLRDIRV